MSDPTSVVVFGASGDLTHRKLLPAWFNLFRKERLPEGVRIVGFAKTAWDDAAFREEMREAVETYADNTHKEEEWEAFRQRLHYVPGDFTQPDDFATLADELEALEDGPAHRLYYLATPPRFYAGIVEHLAELDMAAQDTMWRRVIVEKPFGHDLESAHALNRSLHAVLAEHQIYRIDHFLGKETVQNVLVFRFANTIFEPVWNRNFIDHIQITAIEPDDVGHRAGYYDHAGVVRDMFQNHMMQLLALVAMEHPASFDADAIRNEKVKLIGAIRPIRGEAVGRNTMRGQYEGYRQTDGVAPDSQTATYATVRLFIDNWRWKGVPFYLRSGKALKKKATEIVIEFKDPPHLMFPLPEGYRITPNTLAICVQPDEGVHLRFEAKVPDTDADMRSVDMEFHYQDAFGPGSIPEAYERLLLDALQGDAALFARADGIEKAWGFVDGILEGWESSGGPPLRLYRRGSWGPPEAEEFIRRDGHHWILGCGGH